MSVDCEWTGELTAIRDRVGVAMHRVVARAERLPFRDGSFDGGLSLETVEHLSDPDAAAREMARVLTRDAPLLLTTPPRLRYLASPDPHFGIRGLVALPPRLQRVVAARLGFGAPHHYVDRIYTSAAQIAAVFTEFRLECVLSRSRAPKRWFWDAVLLRRR